MPAVQVRPERDQPGLVLIQQSAHLASRLTVVPPPSPRLSAGVGYHDDGKSQASAGPVGIDADQPGVVLADQVTDLLGRLAVVPPPGGGGRGGMIVRARERIRGPGWLHKRDQQGNGNK